MTDEVPEEWTIEHQQTYLPAGSDQLREYVTYRHDSGDLRLRIAPASLDGDDYPGYLLTVTTFPELDIGDSMEIRRVLAFGRSVTIATRFMALFGANYDGPADFDAALAYAGDRVRAPEVSDALFAVETDEAEADETSASTADRAEADEISESTTDRSPDTPDS